ncbi:hypothetical protein [Terriglobus roseus]|uniref:hypothetical protein n=1 Tax=Terriglobus roseus TaxID=392734 RepID=UPI0009457AA9|nr:hypothetical protein [Terriglobus roseus]
MVALGERDPDSLDFAVVSQGLRVEVHAAYPNLGQIGREAKALRAQVHELRIADRTPVDKGLVERGALLEAQLVAIERRVEMLQGQRFPFDDEARFLFATTRLTDRSVAERSRARSSIESLLPPERRATHQSSSERYAAYDSGFAVPAERLQPVMVAALAACRERTAAHVSLPANESIELAFVRNRPWSAFSRYLGSAHSLIQVNLDFPLTVDEALELACHEGYPGHHVFNTLHEAAFVQQKRWMEASVQPTFSPESFLSEAAAAYAPRMVLSDAERAYVERVILFPLAGLPASKADLYVKISTLVRSLKSAEPSIAQRYVDGDLEFVRAGSALGAEAFMAHPDATLLYLNEYRSYMLAYTDGEERVSRWVDGGAESGGAARTRSLEDRWSRYRELAITPGAQHFLSAE